MTSVDSIELWDGRCWPGRMDGTTPTFRFGWAPDGLLTRRQLREAGLSPGGHEPYARLVWKRDQRFAWLYREDLAAPKRVPTPAQLAAVEAALAARRVCAECGPVDHTVRTTDHLCGDCYAATQADDDWFSNAEAEPVDHDHDTTVDHGDPAEQTEPAPAAEHGETVGDGMADPFQAGTDGRPFGQPLSDEDRSAEEAVDCACRAVTQRWDGQTVHDQHAADGDRTVDDPDRHRSDRAQAVAVWNSTETTDALERARRSLDDLVRQQLQHNDDEGGQWSRGDDLARRHAEETVASDRHDDYLERGVA